MLEGLKGMPCVDLKAPSILKVLNLIDNLNTVVSVYEKQRQGIFESFGINTSQPKEKANEEYLNHPEVQRITDKVRELDDAEAVLDHERFLTQEQVLKCVERMQNITPYGIQGFLFLLVKPKSDVKEETANSSPTP